MSGRPGERGYQQGAALSAAFYADVVRPLIGTRPHSAALVGWGSDVLGYDTQRSTDHGWGPRLVVLLDGPAAIDPVERSLATGLPDTFRSWPVRFGWDAVPVSHHVTVTTLPDWLVGHLGVDATAGMAVLDWLLTPQQRLLGVVSGQVYADDSGALGAVRGVLAWYPDQVWRWLLACQWHRLAQEEAFVARTAEAGDETGSAVIGGRLVRDVMRLALLLDRRYAPYQKWLGTAFAGGRHRDDLPRHLARAVHATDVTARETALGLAYLALARRHNEAGLTRPVSASVGDYYTRPARVLMSDRFTDACLATVSDPALRSLPLMGAVDQVIDNTDVLSAPERYRRLAGLYAYQGVQPSALS
ncbi:MAG: DUF4037 domain-containing protein [Pseudonocardiales bacterium]